MSAGSLSVRQLKSQREPSTHSQLVVFVAANHNVEPLVQRPELLRDALPGIPAHYHRVHRSLWRARRDALEVCHLLREPPRELSALPDAITSRSSNNESEARHGARGVGVDREARRRPALPMPTT